MLQVGEYLASPNCTAPPFRHRLLNLLMPQKSNAVVSAPVALPSPQTIRDVKPKAAIVSSRKKPETQ